MSFYRCEIKTIRRVQKRGRSALRAHQYDARPTRPDLIGVGGENMPVWAAADPGLYWSACDKNERKNGLLARRAILSFPVELPRDLWTPVVRDWLQANCRNMPASWALHDEGDGNPHTHILVSERLNDGIERPPDQWFKRYNSGQPERGGARKADLGSRRHEWILDARKSWADCLNKYLPADAQVDHRSLQDQGVFDHDPQPKIGAKVIGAEKRGHRTQLMSSVIEDSLSKCSICCLSFRDEPGKEITFRAARDHGDMITVVGKPSVVKCKEMTKMCKERGWLLVEVTGSPEFQKMMRAELKRAGIKIKGDGDEQNCEHFGSSSERGGATDSEASRSECAGRTAPVRLPDGRTGEKGANADRAKTEGASAPAGANASATGLVVADRNRDAGDLTDRKSDLRSLAGVEDAVPADENTGSSDMQKTVNLTEVQVRKQLASMDGVETFEVGIRDGRTGKMRNIEMSAADVIASLPRLKRENAKGCDIYIRPASRESHPYVLLDDVGIGTIGKMRADGIEPVVEVLTSPINYQVWVRLPESLPMVDRKAVERLLVKRYGADPNSADGGHYGRLTGFTTRKPSHILDDGRAPFCSLSAHRPSAVLPDAVWRDLLAVIDAPPVPAPQALPLPGAQRPVGGVIDVESAVDSAKRQYASARKKWGPQFDPSRADFFIARNLMQRGATQGVARQAILLQSPDLETRKKGHVDDYLDRTIAKACADANGNATVVNFGV